MKTKLIIAFFLIFAGVKAQDNDSDFSDIEKYKCEVVKSDYAERFKLESDKNDFKRLREYLREKEDLVRALKSGSYTASYYATDLRNCDNMIDKLKQLIGAKGETESIQVSPMIIDEYTYILQLSRRALRTYDANGNFVDPTMTIAEINNVISQLNVRKTVLLQDKATYDMLNKNIKVAKQDIYDASKQIDSALAPEYKKQEFRTNISVCFTILIGLLLMIFFYIVFKKSDNNLSKELLSGNGLQFVTLFVLIIAVILFGILDILKGSELAAILAGISGYILGKGIPDKDNVFAKKDIVEVNGGGVGNGVTDNSGAENTQDATAVG